MPKLKAHLLPRIYRRLLEEEEASEDPHEQRVQLLKSLVSETSRSTDQRDAGSQSTISSDIDRILIHSDRIYHHNILHINYTSYDVRQETDIINPKTSRRDVMCLRDTQEREVEEGSVVDVHRFMHARVLGVYHVNVVYRGRGAADLRKHRFDFLWVRWYLFCEEQPASNSFDRMTLGKVSDSTSIGFLDPADVLRACHIIPRYCMGQLYGPDTQDRIQSKLAKDQEDWCEYYANRCVWGHL